MIESKDIIIGDNEYSITTFNASKGLKYLKQLVKVLAPSFAAMAESTGTEITSTDIKDAIADQTIQTGSLSKAVNLLVDNMDKEDVVELIQNLVASCRCNNKDINFNIQFAGNYGELMQLLLEVCTYNYATVFQAGGLSFAA